MNETVACLLLFPSTMTRAELETPALSPVHPNWSDQVNHNVIQSEVDGGVYLRDLPRGAVLDIRTMDWICRLEYLGDYEAQVSGHPAFCPRPVQVYVAGSTWGGSMLKQFFIGRGMRLEFLHPVHKRILTSPVVDIREVRKEPENGSPNVPRKPLVP